MNLPDKLASLIDDAAEAMNINRSAFICLTYRRMLLDEFVEDLSSKDLAECFSALDRAGLFGSKRTQTKRRPKRLKKDE